MNNKEKNINSEITIETQSKVKKFITVGIVSFLVLALASFGILDFINGGSDYVVKVEEKKVTPQAFSKFLDSQRKQYISRFGGGIIEALLNKKDFIVVTANLMADQLLIAKELEKYGIVVNKDTVNEYILNLPEFKTFDGKFDKNYYNTYLSQIGFSEEDFIMEQIPVIEAKLLMGVIDLIDFSKQERLVRSLIAARNQKREISFNKIKVNFSEKGEVSEQEILNYYIKNKERFVEEEQREVSLARLDEEMARSLAISNERLMREYEEGYIYKNQKLSFYRLTFPSIEEARRAENLIKKEGLALTDVAQKLLGVSSKEIYFKNVPYSDLTPEFAANISKLSKFEVSEIFYSGGAYNLVKLDNISKGKVPSFESVKNKIIARLGKGSGCAEVEKIATKVGEDLDSGETLAKSLNGKAAIQEVKVSASAPSLLGKSVVDAILSDSDTYYGKIIKSRSCEYYAYQITNIRPKSYKNIQEVKMLILKELRKEKSIAAALLKANQEYNKLYSMEKIPTLDETLTLTRLSKTILPLSLVENIFISHEGNLFAPVLSEKEDEFLIVKINKITQVEEDKITDAEVRKTLLELQKMQKDELFRRYMDYLRTQYKVRINHSYLQGAE